MKMGFIWTGIHWDYGHHLNSSRSRGRGFGEIGTNYNDILMFDKCPVGHLTQPAMVWERNKSNDLLLKLNCLFCAKHIEIVRYIGPVWDPSLAPLSIFPGAGRDHRATAPGSPGPAVRRQEIKKLCQIWMLGINYGEWGAMKTSLYAVIENSLSHLHMYTYTVLHSNYGWSSVFFMHSRFSTELKSTFDSVYFQLGSENVSFLSLPSIIPGIFWQLR